MKNSCSLNGKSFCQPIIYHEATNTLTYLTANKGSIKFNTQLLIIIKNINNSYAIYTV